MAGRQPAAVIGHHSSGPLGPSGAASPGREGSCEQNEKRGGGAAPPKPRGSRGTPQPVPRWELCVSTVNAPGPGQARRAFCRVGSARGTCRPPPPPPTPASPSSRLEVHGAARLPLVNWMRRARPWGSSVTCCGLDVGRGPRGAGGWRQVPATGEQTQPPRSRPRRLVSADVLSEKRHPVGGEASGKLSRDPGTPTDPGPERGRSVSV